MAHTASLSYAQIKHLYKEGELDKVRVILENFLKQNEKTADTKDKIFAFKYLGVIYAAEQNTYPMAETYFYKMLKLAPKAYITDLYASAAVEAVFQRTQERYRKENQELSEFDEFGNPRIRPDQKDGQAGIGAGKDSLGRVGSGKVPENRKNPPKEAKIKVWPWVVGTTAIAALGGLWWYTNQEREDREVRLPGS